MFGFWPALAFVVGTVVGTGIYLKPATVSGMLSQPWQALAVWATAGLFATSGAIVYVQLAKIWPHNGGAYYYLTATYGRWAGSLLLAADVLLARPAAVGALATGLGLVWALTPAQGLVLAIALVVTLSVLQLAGQKAQGLGQVALTLLQFVPLLLILVVGVTLGGSGQRALAESRHLPDSQWATAFLSVLWAYDGWYNITILAGEVKTPERTLKKALIGGMVGVTLLYLLLNAVLFNCLPRQELEGSAIAFLPLLQRAQLGNLGVLIQIALTLALASTLNGTLACGARMLVAGAQDGLIQGGVGHKGTGARPTVAFALWCIGLLCLFGGLSTSGNLFDRLTELTAVVVTLLSALTVTCLFRQVGRKEVPASALACGVFYLGVSLILAALMFWESVTVGLWGTLSVGLLGTLLWTRAPRS